VTEWPRTRAILNPRAGQARFAYADRMPDPALAGFVSHFWLVSWDLRGQEPHRQQVLPHPSVVASFMTGRCRVAGVLRGHFAEVLSGAGRVVGVRFRPGGFRPLLGAPVASITDRFLPFGEVFGADGAAAADAVVAAPDADGAVAALAAFLRRIAPPPDPNVDLAAGIVAAIQADPALTRVGAVARAAGLGARALQRLFHEYVGVGPKWVIRRYRMHEAASRVGAGDEVDWAALAVELGYADQAHFTRDFTATVGMSPTRYARACAGPTGQPRA
jgi:AraC-like DNA-binding protein